jgi:hypothetical protein
MVVVFDGKATRKETTRKKKPWMQNVEMDLAQIIWGVVESIRLPQNRNKMRIVVVTVIKLRV